MIESAFKLTMESINYRGSCYRHKDWMLYCWERGYSDLQVLAAHLRPGRESHRRLPTRKQNLKLVCPAAKHQRCPRRLSGLLYQLGDAGQMLILHHIC